MVKKMYKKMIFFFFMALIYAVCMIMEPQKSEETAEYNVEEEEKNVALTFDDGPGEYTDRLLDGLKKRNAKATFFLIGRNAKEYPDVVYKMVKNGNLVGNHTYNHVRLNELSEEEALSEINKTNNLITILTGKSVKYIRPPYGHWNDEIENQIDMKEVLWDVDPRDWCILDSESVVKHIEENVKPGDIILLHDIFETSVDAALEIVDILSEQGYEFVTVDELYGEK